MAVAYRSSSIYNSGASTTTSVVLNKPTGTTAGDVLLLAITSSHVASQAYTPPSGWTQQYSGPGTSSDTVLYSRVADGTETSTFTFTFSSARASAIVAAYSGAQTLLPSGFVNVGVATTSTSTITPPSAKKLNEVGYIVKLGSTYNATSALTITSAGTGATLRADTTTTATSFVQTYIADGETVALPISTTQSPTTLTTSAATTERTTYSVTLFPTTDLVKLDIADVNSTTASSVTSFTQFRNFPANTLHVLAIHVAGSSTTISSISDAAGLLWTQKVAYSAGSIGTFYLYYAYASSSTSASITINLSASGSANSIIWGFANGTGIGATSTTTTSATTSPSTSLTTTAGNSWVRAMMGTTSTYATVSAGTSQDVVSNTTTNSNMFTLRAQSLTLLPGTSVTSSATIGNSLTTGIMQFEVLQAPVTKTQTAKATIVNDRYWVGGTGSFTDTAHWSMTSGGTGGASAPSYASRVHFDASSFTATGQTVTLPAYSGIYSMDWTGATNSPTFNMGNFELDTYGDLKFTGGMTITNAGKIYILNYTKYILNLPGDTNVYSLQTGGHTLKQVYIEYAARVSLLDDITLTSSLILGAGNGALTTNNHNINVLNFYADDTITLTLGTSTITASGNVDFGYSTYSGPNNLSAANATVVMTNTTGVGYYYATPYQTVGTVTIGGASVNYSPDNHSTINNLTFQPGTTVLLGQGSGYTTTIGTSLTLGGTASNPIIIKNKTGITGQQGFSMASGTVNGTYLQLTNTVVSGGATFYARNSVDLGGNTGWTFASPRGQLATARIQNTVSKSQAATAAIIANPPVKKYWLYKVYNNGVYLGMLPNVINDFSYPQDINTAGAQITIKVGATADVSSQPSAGPITDESGNPITDESGNNLLIEGAINIVGTGSDTTLIKNGNRVVVYEFSKYYPNGKVMFNGQMQRWEAPFGGDNGEDAITVLCYSDGSDMDNYLLQGSPFVLDQSQTAQDSSWLVYTNSKSGGFGKAAQTFTTASGVTNVGAIDLDIAAATTAVPVTVSLYANIANANAGTGLLGTVTQTISNTSPQITKFAFSSPITVTASTQYAFTVAATGSGANVYYKAAASYSGGDAYHDDYSGAGGDAGLTVVTGADLYFNSYSSAGSTTATFTSKDPTTGMLEPIIDAYRPQGGLIGYTPTSIDATGLSLTYSFNTATVYDGMETISTLLPNGWYYYVDLGTDTLFVKQTPTTPDFTFIKGKHLSHVNIIATIESIKNTVYFSGGLVSGSNLFSVYKNADSISKYGPRLEKMSDNRVTIQATANAIGNNEVAKGAAEQYQTVITIVDGTMDVTLLRPGHVIGFTGFGSFIDNLLSQVVRVEYYGDYVTLTLGILPKRLSPDFEKITRGLIAEQTVSNPSTPS